MVSSIPSEIQTSIACTAALSTIVYPVISRAEEEIKVGFLRQANCKGNKVNNATALKVASQAGARIGKFGRIATEQAGSRVHHLFFAPHYVCYLTRSVFFKPRTPLD